MYIIFLSKNYINISSTAKYVQSSKKSLKPHKTFNVCISCGIDLVISRTIQLIMDTLSKNTSKGSYFLSVGQLAAAGELWGIVNLLTYVSMDSLQANMATFVQFHDQIHQVCFWKKLSAKRWSGRPSEHMLINYMMWPCGEKFWPGAGLTLACFQLDWWHVGSPTVQETIQNEKINLIYEFADFCAQNVMF